LKQRIDETAKEILVKEYPDLIVVEQLKKMGFKSKAKRLLAKSIRRSIGTWNWKYWLKRLEAQCEINRVSFRSVAPYYTSTTCPACGHSDRGNRLGEVFLCLSCGHGDNADINAGKNILNRFLTGQYGARYKEIKDVQVCADLF
jgi:putative transposase